MVGANNCNITNNEIFDITGTGESSGCSGGGNGIFIYGVSVDRGNYNTIDGNKLYDNIKSGFFMKMKCMHNIIGNNVATGNAQGGIVLRCAMSNCNTIEDNSASENSWHGIYIGGKDNIIRCNTVTNNNECGIDMGRSDGSYNNEVYENTACGNGDADISTCGLQCYGNHGDDNTCDTTSNYDDDGTTGCTFSCAPPEKPDLIITEKYETLGGSGTLEVTYIMKNNGGGDADASATGIYIGNTHVATDSVGALSAGASHTGTVTIDSFNCPCGTTVAVKVYADNESVVDESDEMNNCLENTFNCPPCVADPQLCPIPDHNFDIVPPGQTETGEFDVTNCGGAGTLTWTVSDDQTWITVSPTSGTGAGIVTVTINTAGLSDGTHTGTVTVVSDHGTETGTIIVTVKGLHPPPPADVPTFTLLGMLILAGLLGITAIGSIRRR
jgi:parallel beta-helix repeat protein